MADRPLVHFSSKVEIISASDFTTSKDESDYLGCGGFAAVRLCRHSRLGRVVAKCFTVTGTKEEIRKRLNDVKREADVLVRMTHHHIVKIHGITNWDGNITATMLEYVECGSLDGLIRSNHPLSWSLRHQFSQQLNSALTYLHNHPDGKVFYHGDIKPENVLLDRHLNVKLADFGSVNIVKASGWNSTTIDVAPTTQHTLCYSAPEMLRGENPGPPADIYSFGMFLYELNTRTKVYTEVHHQHILGSMIMNGMKPDLAKVDEVKATLTKDIDRKIFALLVEVMKKCWNRDSKARPTALEIGKILEISNERDSNLEREKKAISRQLRRHRRSSGQVTKLSNFAPRFVEAPNAPTVLLDENFFAGGYSGRTTSSSSEADSFLLQIGGQRSEQDATKYDVSNNDITIMPILNEGRWASTSVKWENRVCTFGGEGPEGILRSCEMFDLVSAEERWAFLPEMPEGRCRAASAVVNGSILISGGRVTVFGKSLSTCLLYDVKLDSWSKSHAMMITSRSSHAMVTLNDIAYCIGGWDENGTALSLCEKYQDDRWLEIPAMCDARYGVAVVAHEQCIYAIGGGYPNDTTVERYDPRMNEWTRVQSTNVGHWYHGACVSQGSIYAVAGLGEKSVEVYDPRADKWTHCFETQKRRDYCNVVSI